MNAGNGHGEIRLVVPARSESLTVVRQIAAGAADAFGLDEEEAADLKVVVAEASNNVVRHAFGEGQEAPRAFEVEIEDAGRSVVAIVRDRGGGFIPTAGGDSLGLGIPIMASISRALELRSIEGGGVELRAEIPVSRPGPPPDTDRPGKREERSDQEAAEPAVDGTAARVTVGSSKLLRSVLARMIGFAAAGAGLTTDELADGLMVSDALAGAATWDGAVEVTVTEHDDRIQLTLGPLPQGAGQGMLDALEVPGIGSLARAASGVSVELGDGPGEELVLTVTRREAG